MWHDIIGDTQLNVAYNGLTESQSIVIDSDIEADPQNIATNADAWSDCTINGLDLHRIAAEAEDIHLKQKRIERGKNPGMFTFI